MRLSDEQLRDVLARAEEIQGASRSGRERDAEVRAVIQAAEEVGLERAAVERALREQLNVGLEPPAVGDLVFAKSADEKYFVAEVLSALAAGVVRVRFLRGSDHEVTLDHLRPGAFLPGQRVVVNWPWWGPWTCTVISYDASKRRIKVTDGWGTTKTFPISEVWVDAVRKQSGGNRMRVYLTLLGSGAAFGSLIGSALTWLLTR